MGSFPCHGREAASLACRRPTPRDALACHPAVRPARNQASSRRAAPGSARSSAGGRQVSSVGAGPAAIPATACEGRATGHRTSRRWPIAAPPAPGPPHRHSPACRASLRAGDFAGAASSPATIRRRHRAPHPAPTAAPRGRWGARATRHGPARGRPPRVWESCLTFNRLHALNRISLEVTPGGTMDEAVDAAEDRQTGSSTRAYRRNLGTAYAERPTGDRDAAEAGIRLTG